MCFFDQYQFICGDWRWAGFREHCNKVERIGHTCGMRLILDTVSIGRKCNLCIRIDIKRRRRKNEMERINRWRRENVGLYASIEKAEEVVWRLNNEIARLSRERIRRQQSFC
ncbi:hypothetical protein B0J11DRAFT_199436 [Dendryphion nanum]|uniref:Uncharacterized protein n=1 Tax=Dendryphion nanum TaxID=256645 RepID=A0A9P9CX91_9PLEO|nr:hypothetical protein B0J11DRAFT_241794 [Dendryphion nanum]KAH7111113.1 hypothetical protein B0J11DRAFT_199436 [Dendryphion nanum]